MTYILATANPGKVKEMKEVLSGLSIDVITRDDLGISIDVEETGTTFFENAMLKAKAICAASKMPAIADDSGLIVDALGGEPGVYTSSYGGEHLTSEERYMYLLSRMKQFIYSKQRSAKFISTIVCAFPNGDIISATGECPGTIAAVPCGTSGFGYDPVFIPVGKRITMAEMSSFEKNAISHRGKALREFAMLLSTYNSSAGQTLLQRELTQGNI